MILALSRFRVKSGHEAEVRAAFVNRPRRVESVAGFLGLEVYVDERTPSAFLLLTRWTDVAAFRGWHASPEHHASHALMPKGLKLDPAGTELIQASRIELATAGGREAELLADLTLPLSQVLREGEALHVVEVAADDTVVAANHAFERAIGRAVAGLRFEELIAPTARETAREVMRQPGGQPMLLQFVDQRAEPFSLRCRIAGHRDGMVVLGEPPWADQRALEVQLSGINAELAAQLRENTRQARALAEVHAKLRDAHWHLEKLAEVLPMCVACKRVQSGQTGQAWEPVEAFLKRTSTFLSHGYCAACEAALPGGRDGGAAGEQEPQ